MCKFDDEKKQAIQSRMSVFLNEEANKKLLSKLSDIDKVIIHQVMITKFYVSRAEIEKAKQNDYFKYILSLFEESKKNNKINDKLIFEYKRNKNNALRYLYIKRGKLFKRILSTKFSQYQYLKRKGDAEICKKIIDGKFKNLSEETKKKVELLNSDIKKYEKNKHPLVLELSSTMLLANVSNTNMLEYFSYIVCNPKCQLTSLIFTDNHWDVFPLRWLSTELFCSDFRKLFSESKNGHDISYYFTEKYDNNDFSNLKKLLSSPFISDGFTEIIGNRNKIIDEIIESYRRGSYSSVIYTSLPQIEGMIWSFSKFVHNVDGGIYADTDYKVGISENKNIENLSIGSLLKHTKLKGYLQDDFIKYFCDELYDERNDLLHGNELSKLTKKNAGMKIATLEFLLSQINNFAKETFTLDLRKEFTEEYINSLLDKYIFIG